MQDSIGDRVSLIMAEVRLTLNLASIIGHNSLKVEWPSQ